MREDASNDFANFKLNGECESIVLSFINYQDNLISIMDFVAFFYWCQVAYVHILNQMFLFFLESWKHKNRL